MAEYVLFSLIIVFAIQATCLSLHVSPTLEDHILIDTLRDAVGVGGVDVVPVIDAGKTNCMLGFHFL